MMSCDAKDVETSYGEKKKNGKYLWPFGRQESDLTFTSLNYSYYRVHITVSSTRSATDI